MTDPTRAALRTRLIHALEGECDGLAVDGERAEAILQYVLGDPPAPIDMVLHCPVCGRQHIDAPEYESAREDPFPAFGEDPAMSWGNPPHRSHLCAGCGHIWRPTDVPTNGVAAVKTKGKNDSPVKAPQPVAQGDVPPVLVRDLAEIIGVGVPSVCAALLEIGRPPRSTNMAIGGEEAVAVAKRLAAAPAEVVGEPVAWSPDLTYPGYSQTRVWANGAPHQKDIDYWRKEGYGITLAYTAPPARQALTDEQIDKIIFDCNDFLYMQDMHPRRERAIARAIERAHGIGGKGGK